MCVPGSKFVMTGIPEAMVKEVALGIAQVFRDVGMDVKKALRNVMMVTGWIMTFVAIAVEAGHLGVVMAIWMLVKDVMTGTG